MSFIPDTINILDIVLVVILVLFTVRGVLRGFVLELAGIIALVGSIMLAGNYAHDVSSYLSQFLNDSGWAYAVSYVGIILMVFLGVEIITRLLPTIIKINAVAWFNHVAGAMVGLLKGLIVASILVVLLQGYFANMEFVRSSYLLPHAVQIGELFKDYLPHAIKIDDTYEEYSNG